MYIDKLPEDKHAHLCCPHGIGTVSDPLNAVYHIVENIVIFLYSLKLFLLFLSSIHFFSVCAVVIRIPQPVYPYRVHYWKSFFGGWCFQLKGIVVCCSQMPECQSDVRFFFSSQLICTTNWMRIIESEGENESKEEKKIDSHIDMRIVELTLLFIKCSFVTVAISIALTHNIPQWLLSLRHTHTHPLIHAYESNQCGVNWLFSPFAAVFNCNWMIFREH